MSGAGQRQYLGSTAKLDKRSTQRLDSGAGTGNALEYLRPFGPVLRGRKTLMATQTAPAIWNILFFNQPGNATMTAWDRY